MSIPSAPQAAPALDAHVLVPERGVDVRLRLEGGRTLALTGPNGAGKSTALAVVSGLLRPAAGYVRLGERVLTEASTGIHVPAHRRGVVTLTQQASLFPHLNVRDNIAFPLRARGLGRRAARERAQEQIAMLDLDELADRRPARLSGGQAQRAALARALAADPALLLLDEPLAALDADVAARMRAHLGRALVGRTAVIVTHQREDVAALADAELALA